MACGIALLHLASGIPVVLASAGMNELHAVLAVVYVSCFVAMAVGALRILRGNGNVLVSRLLVLCGIGIPAVIVFAPGVKVSFPAIVYVPLVFRTSYSTGQSQGFGVNLLAAAAFLVLWFSCRESKAEALAEGK
jgi:hypothetical protein